MKIWDVVVIGGGPAGLFAGIAAAEQGAQVLILEKREKPGGKIPVSGGGRGNLTHVGEIPELLRHYQGGETPDAAARFLKPALYTFSNLDLMKFFSARGLPLGVEPDGRVFPKTDRAEDALRVLLSELERTGVEIRTQTRVSKIQKVAHGFAIFAQGLATPIARGSSVILATGGRSCPSLGATGDGYRLAAELGHRVVPPRPALVPVVVASQVFSPFAESTGITLRGVGVTLIRRGKTVRKARGGVLFTHQGLSGPAVLNLSRDVEPGDILRVSFLSEVKDTSAVEREFLAQARNHGRRTISRALQELGLPLRLARALVRSLGMAAETRLAELSREGRRALVETLVEGYPFPIAGFASWEEAMVTRGGIALNEVDHKTMESLLVRGLFFAGEVLDIDGETGGYNLQAAFSTGFLAGKSAAQKAKD
ncbi:MAG: NAD(P)/FAD-dependent oxidoreductase [Candidatus Bipolaricaulaceae bacterium]